MIELIALEYDRPIWVNPSLITSFESHHGGTIIYFDQDNNVKVKQTPQQLLVLCPPPRGNQ